MKTRVAHFLVEMENAKVHFGHQEGLKRNAFGVAQLELATPSEMVAEKLSN